MSARILVCLLVGLSVGCGTSENSPRPSDAIGNDSLPTDLWVDATDRFLPKTAEWTNRVELADVDGDGRVDLLFANGGNYSEPGEPELNRVFLNRGSGQRFEEATEPPRPLSPAVIRAVAGALVVVAVVAAAKILLSGDSGP